MTLLLFLDKNTKASIYTFGWTKDQKIVLFSPFYINKKSGNP